MKRQDPIARFFKHMLSNPWQVRRYFSEIALHEIQKAITASEKKHGGEIRFVVEAGLHPYEIICKKTPEKRAIELFGRLNIWDTEHNNGVLIYLLLADRDVEIVADRGIDRHVGRDGWEAICHDMEALFGRGEFETGVLYGIEKISAALEQYFPLMGVNKNEVSDKPVIL